MTYKRVLALLAAAVLAFSLAGCKEQGNVTPVDQNANVVLDIYAPMEAMAILSDLTYRYSADTPRVTFRITYDDGDIQTAKIEAGYPCDVFVADEPSFMDWLDAECGEDVNPNRNDKIVSATRADFMKGPGNEAYMPEDVALEEDEVYTTTYSVAVCRATAKYYESERFVQFMLSEDVQELYNQYGFSSLRETEDEGETDEAQDE